MNVGNIKICGKNKYMQATQYKWKIPDLDANFYQNGAIYWGILVMLVIKITVIHQVHVSIAFIAIYMWF